MMPLLEDSAGQDTGSPGRRWEEVGEGGRGWEGWEGWEEWTLRK